MRVMIGRISDSTSIINKDKDEGEGGRVDRWLTQRQRQIEDERWTEDGAGAASRVKVMDSNRDNKG